MGPAATASTRQGLQDRAPLGGVELGWGGSGAAPHSPCPRRARPLKAPAKAPAKAAAGARAASAPSGCTWWAPAESTRRLPGHHVPFVARAAESGCEARLANRSGADFVGLSRAVRPSPPRLFDCGSKGGKKWLRSRPRPTSPSTHQAMSFRPGRRAQEARKGCAPVGQVGEDPGLGVKEVMLPRSWSRGGARGLRAGGGDFWGCAMGRRQSKVEGVASGRAQIKWEARRAWALRGPAGSGSRRCHLAAFPFYHPPPTCSRRTCRRGRGEEAAEWLLDLGAAEPGGVRPAGWR